MNIRIEISSLATLQQSGVAAYTRLLIDALGNNKDVVVYGSYLNFLGRQPDPELHNTSISFERNSFVPLRVYAKAQSFRSAPPFDIFLPSVDLTIFPNFATWPTAKSKLSAAVIHDLTYIRYPEVVEAKNLEHLKRVVPRSIKQADFIITVSESVKAELVKEFQLNPARCVVTQIPPSIDFYQKNNNEVHKKYGIPTKKYIYFIGNLEPRKNLSVLLDAYLRLPSKIKKEYSLILAGSKGWKNETLQANLKAAEEAGENVRHIGFIDQADSSALYQKASLFVMPSLYEGFGMPILEAMACHCPVISSDIPVLHEVGGDAVLYADPYSVKDFCDKILWCLEKNTISPEWEEKAKNNLARFSWEKNVDRIVALTNKLLST